MIHSATRGLDPPTTKPIDRETVAAILKHKGLIECPACKNASVLGMLNCKRCRNTGTIKAPKGGKS